VVTFELRDAAGGWEQARFGPSDQVDYALYEDDGDTERDPVLTSYDSVHTFLRLYDLARLERTTHPDFLGVTLRETGRAVGADDGDRDELLELAVHGTTVRTTYPELRAALESFFAALFPALDRETPGERPDLATFDVGVLDLAEVYAAVVKD
jgi:hypothetical protein